MEKKQSENEVQLLPENDVSYRIENKTFVVVPVFQRDGKETLATILMRLIKSDITYS